MFFKENPEIGYDKSYYMNYANTPSVRHSQRIVMKKQKKINTIISVLTESLYLDALGSFILNSSIIN